MRNGTVNAHMGSFASSAAAPAVIEPTDTPAQTGLGRLLPSRSETLFGVDIGKSDEVGEGLDKNAFKSIKLLATVFTLFFVVVAVIAIGFMSKRHGSVERDAALSEAASLARDIGGTLDGSVAWVETAVSAGSPQQVVDVAVRGDNVAAAALVTGGEVVAAQPAAAEAYLGPLANDGETRPGKISIKRLVAENGDVNPVIVRHIEGGQVVIALATGTILPSRSANAVVVSPTGLVIDGPPNIVARGILDGLGMTETDLVRATTQAPAGEVRKWTRSGGDSWLTSVRVPNSDLSLLVLQPRTASPYTRTLWIVFLSLFVGTALLVKAMMGQALGSLKKVQTSFQEDEVTRQRFQAAIESIGGGVFEIDLPTKEVFLSAPLVSLLRIGDSDRHLPLTEVLGLLHEDSREAFHSQVRRAHMTGQFSCDVQIRHLPLVLSCQGKPTLRSDAGDDIPTRKVIVGVANDVTEQRGAQTRLRAAEARLFDALRSMTDAIVVWDQLDRLVLWNARFEEFFGFQPGNLRPGLERSVVDYYAQNQVETSNTDINGSTEISLKDGRWLRYLESQTQDGGRVSIATDVTEIRSREQLLRENNDQLERQYETLSQTQSRLVQLAREYEHEKIRAEEANQSKSEFLANMSHELRTPLNAINGFSDIMQKEMFGPLGDPRYKEYVNDILFSGTHLLSLINDILDMSKIEAGKMTLNTDSVSVGSLIEQVVRIVRGRAEEARLSLVYDSVETQVIEADPRAVKQVLLNLIGNAIKFTPEGGTVKVVVEPKQQGVIIRVADSGMGISEEDLVKLAQPFEQASNNKSGEGTGLGLALSKSLVELHGGNFHIASKLGQGTTITFTLPNRPVPKEADDAAEESVSAEISRLATTISNALEHGRQTKSVPPLPKPPQASAYPETQTQPQPAADGPVPYTPPAA